jgi:hypothetical protein
VFTRACHWSLPRASCIQSTPSHPISLRSILILSSHIRTQNKIFQTISKLMTAARNTLLLGSQFLQIKTKSWPQTKCKGKGKVVPVFLNEHHDMEAYWEIGNTASRILDLSIRWSCVVRFTVRPFYLQGKSPCYQLTRRLGGPRADLDAVMRRKIPNHYRELNPRSSASSPALYDWAIPFPLLRQHGFYWIYFYVMFSVNKHY